MSSIQDSKARLAEAQKKQKGARKNARAQANDTNRVNQGLQPRSASFQQAGPALFKKPSPEDEINDPGSPDEYMEDDEAFIKQFDAHQVALAKKDTAENKAFDDWSSRKEGRCEARDLTFDTAEMIRERSGHTTLESQKRSNLSRENRTTPFPDRGGQRDGR